MPYIRRAVVAVALLFAVAVVVVRPGDRAYAADQQGKVTRPVPLLELRTAGDAGWFWTLNEAEANSAANSGMSLQHTRLGYLRAQPFSGSQPIYRIRVLARPTYLLSASKQECDTLDQSGGYDCEGIVGYAAASQQPGTDELWRMSNGSEWRVVPEAQRAAFAAKGYRTDGPLGYVYPTYDQVGAIYFGSFDADGNQDLMAHVKSVYGRDGDWWGGVRDFAGSGVPVNRWHWPQTDFSDLEPSIGYYDDSQPATLEKQISAASSAGLSYFTFYWYWNPAGGGAEQYIDGLKAFLKAANRSNMDFSVMPCLHPWSNGDVSLHLPEDQIDKAAKTIADEYLGQPNYLRANDGRPMIQVCDTRGIGDGTATSVDAEATKRFTDALRTEARNEYGEDLLITLNADLGVPASGSGFDGTQCQGQYDTSRSFQHYADDQRAYFTNFPGTLMRCASSGFDDRPRDGIAIADPGANATEQQLEASFHWYDDHSIDRFGTLLANVQADIDASARPPAVDNFVLVYAWNEWHEGGHIEPNKRDGCAYLDAIQAKLHLLGSGCAS
ncbi:glycoside hydrolase family 99-like domain-containing protein [Actinoallomurus iriomotensis]|uniref:DUF5648 domain-containing protein n=1 Tax=Actinoallomurus iriomotensis TaxID=478107 RepID=A0A9W6S560_9ACTN|nr:glycoside hydrolase family 99-like domain-containing protein [Actinoallomurus iriomotensis]GLY85932.1 hypothetical protein Airi02_038610 [Actinoallomurus iriomotensis]